MGKLDSKPRLYYIFLMFSRDYKNSPLLTDVTVTDLFRLFLQ